MMKKIEINILLIAIILYGFSVKVSADSQSGEKRLTSAKDNESPEISMVKDMASVEGNDSTLNLKSGNRGLAILESLEGPSFNIKKYSEKEEFDQEDNDHKHARRRSRFRGHWTGIELGYNNYLSSDKSFSMPSDIDYMTLQSSKSSNFNINFTQLSLGLTRHIGFVTGLGLNWNNYRFDGNNNIQKGPGGIIEELDPSLKLEKSKLATLFLTLPLMLEIQIPVDNNRLHIAAGPVGALKLSSHTKMVFEDGHTVKSWGDFSLNMLRYGATARVGYGNFQLFGTYYYTPLFQSGKGPASNDLYPFEIGIALAFNN
ncbi:MAG: outer membrane beta-barrel protein [Bacteroidales bacterium]